MCVNLLRQNSNRASESKCDVLNVSPGWQTCKRRAFCSRHGEMGNVEAHCMCRTTVETHPIFYTVLFFYLHVLFISLIPVTSLIPPRLCILPLYFLALRVGSDRAGVLRRSRGRRLTWQLLHATVFLLQRRLLIAEDNLILEREPVRENRSRRSDIKWSVGHVCCWVVTPAEPHNWLWAVDRVTAPAGLVY